MYINREMVKKLWYSHTMEYYVAIKRNVDQFDIILCNYLQGKQLHKKR